MHALFAINVTSAAKNLTYQIEVSWPFGWEYVVDGNALGMTASEGFKRRLAVEPSQPDSVVVSIGYPLSDDVYSFTRRAVDFRPPLPTPQTPPSGADEFIDFIDASLRPWIRSTLFPGVRFTRDALYGHSFGGLFVVFALIARPDMFDTFLSASPALDWANGSMLNMVSQRLGTGGGLLVYGSCGHSRKGTALSRPAVVISYGSLEQFPVRRRTETEAEFQARKAIILSFSRMTDYCHELFDRLQGSRRARDVVLKEYMGQDHSSVAASAVVDGIDYFVDW
ncbi:Alpha/Beta hydrolase protein [Lasiosphaeria miniovina]|uniref:Alpha/Beta hydrolase protein n=1 Tax=Lasiosphaeria miniovina TaxID=1954250 RepID=A0AA40BJ45_9PEZI|nr:Alpha/Beta hydrolase protein [Lasiosphaeria miniovina]KAK0735166.1 Alpha/Beta hydrolase protein [Lasiosphaeria miniovina]